MLKGGMINRTNLQQATDIGGELRFGASAVMALCKAVRAPMPTAAQRDKDFGFNWFHDAYPNFPVFMDAAKTDLNIADFWNAPSSTKAWETYFKLAEEYRRSTFGLITNGPGIGKLVLHNAWFLTPAEGCQRLERRNKKDKNKGLVIEDLESFAESILLTWSP